MAVAGLGRIGWGFHCNSIAQHSRFKLTAVCDNDEQRLAEARERFGCELFKDYEAMLRQPGLEAVAVATPTHLHKQMAQAAFRAGLHVFLEKPMAMDAREAQSIARSARRAGKVLTVYQPHRARALFQQVLKMVRSGRIGSICHVRLGVFRYVRRDDWQSLRRYGGGMLNNYGAHYLDLALVLTGHRIKRTFCQLKRVATLGDADDVVKLIYEAGSGALGEVDISMASTSNPYEMEVCGTRGSISKQGEELVLRYYPAGSFEPGELNRSLTAAERAYPSSSPTVREERIRVDEKHAIDVYRELARAIRDGKEPFVPPEQTVALMKLIDTCRSDAGRILDLRSEAR